MPSKKIEKELITHVVSQSVGEEALDIVFYLRDKKDISEFTIAQELDLEIHAIRNILYRLHNNNLVTYIRRKDREKGWYISYWTFNEPYVPELDRKMKLAKLRKFEERLEKEEANRGNYFLCPSACTRMDFATATDHEFRCPECGSILNQQDNERTITTLKENIEELKKQI